MCDKSQRLVTLVLLMIRGILAGNVVFAASFGNIAAGQTNAPNSAPAMPGCVLDDRFFEAEVKRLPMP